MLVTVRFHNRGGQGGMIAGNILAAALMKEGKYAQSFPLFGPERRGAPVITFVRVDDKRMFVRGESEQADDVVVFDPTLRRIAQIDRGLREGGWIIMNSPQEPDAFDFAPKFRIATVDAGSLATRYGLGSPQYPVVNTAMLGALVRVTRVVSLNTLLDTIAEEIDERNKDKNVAIANEAYGTVRFTGNG